MRRIHNRGSSPLRSRCGTLSWLSSGVTSTWAVSVCVWINWLRARVLRVCRTSSIRCSAPHKTSYKPYQLWRLKAGCVLMINRGSLKRYLLARLRSRSANEMLIVFSAPLVSSKNHPETPLIKSPSESHNQVRDRYSVCKVLDATVSLPRYRVLGFLTKSRSWMNKVIGQSPNCSHSYISPVENWRR